MLDLVVAAAAVGVWLLAYATCRLLTRPAAPAPAPATMDLGPESPALVSLLVNRWTPTVDAAESTLLDLAARRFVELRQPGADPMETTVHLPPAPPSAQALRPYERRVLERIRGLAVGGVVPITALTFRDAGESKEWNKQLRREVIAEARAAGLSRRRMSPAIVTLLTTLALAAGVVVAAAVAHYNSGRPEQERPPWFILGLVTFVALGIFGARPLGERDTAAGREVASRWLGVRDWLRGHDQFASLPPAAVAVWDRYLAYGAAVGVTRLASAVLDLEMADKRLVWSSFDGVWHRVRVRYPGFWPRYGQPLKRLVFRGSTYVVVGVAVVRFLGSNDYLASAGLILVLLGTYVLVRSLLDLALTREITGEVLWRETWKTRGRGEDEPPEPWLDHLAVDDGSADRTTAWALPSDWGSRCHVGDTVTFRVRPWSRLVVEVIPVGHGRSRSFTETLTADETGSLSLAMFPSPAPGSSPAAPVSPPSPSAIPSLFSGFSSALPSALFSVDEIGQVVGPVRGEPLPLGLQYISDISGKPVMFVQWMSGLPGRVAWRANSRGTSLPGGGFVNGDRAAFRLGDTTYVVTLLGDGRSGRDRLPWLVAQAAARSGS